MKKIVIDFETYYDDKVSVVGQGTPNYVRDADAYIVGVQMDGLAQCGTLKEMSQLCCNLVYDPTLRPVAANSNFDQAFWEKYFPSFDPPWECLLDLVAYHQHPRNLASLAGGVLGERVDKTQRDQMKGVTYESLDAARQIAVQEYCMNDCVKEFECLEKLPPMSSVEEKVALHTRAMNRRGVQINTDLVAEDKTKLEAMRFEAFKGIPWHADAKPLSYPALAKYCASQGLPCPKSTAKTDEECANRSEERRVGK